MKINGKEIKINRANAVISEVDTAYCTLLMEILNEGLETENRTGINTKSIAGWSYKFHLDQGFPIMETKDVKAKNFSSEIQWIHQVQSNEVKWLQDRDNPVWNQWVVDEDGIYRIYEQGENALYDPEKLVPLKRQILLRTDNGLAYVGKEPVLDGLNKPIMVQSWDLMKGEKNPRTIKEAILFGKEWAGTIGDAYGNINKQTMAPQKLEWTIKNNPTDRRMIVSLWQDEHLPKAVLPSCVWSQEYKVTPDGRLHSFVHQRSADVPLGVPFNIGQYALLLSMYAKACGLEPGTMSWSIMDAHIYLNQLEGIKKQLKRFEYMLEYAEFIQQNTDEAIEREYTHLENEFDKTHEFIKGFFEEDVDTIKMSVKLKKLKQINKDIAEKYEEEFERKVCFEHMLTRETPVLELEEHTSIFDYSTEYVKKGVSYLEENPIGNKELVLKNYHPTPFISMPIAQ